MFYAGYTTDVSVLSSRVEAWLEVKKKYCGTRSVVDEQIKKSIRHGGISEEYPLSSAKCMLDREDNLMTFMLPFPLLNLTQDRKNCFTGRQHEIGISGNIACENFVKKLSTFRLDLNLETDHSSKTNFPPVDVLTDESASDEFCSIIGLS